MVVFESTEMITILDSYPTGALSPLVPPLEGVFTPEILTNAMTMQIFYAAARSCIQGHSALYLAGLLTRSTVLDAPSRKI